MRFHPVISIIIGYVTYFILVVIVFYLFGARSVVGAVLHFVPVVIAGFIATYFAKERKIRYGIYEGLVIIMISFLDSIGIPIGSSILGGVAINIISASIGGLIAAKINRK